MSKAALTKDRELLKTPIKIAVYPGTFDPITFGHIDVIKRALKLFDKVIIGVTTNPKKEPLFSLTERIEMAKNVLREIKNIEVKGFTGLLVDFARKQKAIAIIRGLRELSDFTDEFKLASMNRKLAPEIETVMIVTDEKYFYLSSGLVKEIAKFGGDVREFVPLSIEKKLMKKLRKNKRSS